MLTQISELSVLYPGKKVYKIGIEELEIFLWRQEPRKSEFMGFDFVLLVGLKQHWLQVSRGWWLLSPSLGVEDRIEIQFMVVSEQKGPCNVGKRR